MTGFSKKMIALVAVAAAAMPLCSAGDNWAIVNLSANFMREKPGYAEENGCQALMGAVCEVLETKGYWVKIKTGDYTAWTNEMGLVKISREEKDEYLSSSRWICTADYTHIWSEASTQSLRLCDITAGGIVRKTSGAGWPGWTAVKLPDGRKGWMQSDDITDFRRWVQGRKAAACRDGLWDPKAADAIVASALNMNGVPYMWGGNSTKSVDCSGLVKLVYLLNGISLPRNASDQAAVLPDVEGAVSSKGDIDESVIQPGDLLFFGKAAAVSSPMKISHVGIWIGNGQFIHASQVVRISTLEEYSRKPVCIRRVLGNVGKPGVTAVAEDPYYFTL